MENRDYIDLFVKASLIFLFIFLNLIFFLGFIPANENNIINTARENDNNKSEISNFLNNKENIITIPAIEEKLKNKPSKINDLDAIIIDLEDTTTTTIEETVNTTVIEE